MKFPTRLSNILEAMGSATYQIPELPYHLMADFYLIQLLEAHQLAAHSNRAEKLQYELESVKRALVPFLREHLLDRAGYSIVCELRHVYDSSSIPIGQGQPSLNPQEKTQLLIDNGCPEKLIEILINHSHQDTRPNYQELDKNDHYNAARAGSVLFNKNRPLKWRYGYGGEPWAQACRSWLSLYNAKGMNDTIIYVDKLYSTEHNNGSLLDKNKEYEGPWVKRLLDLKFKANNPEELLPYASPFMKKLGRMWLVQATGRGWGGNDLSHRLDNNYCNKFFELLLKRFNGIFMCKRISSSRMTVSDNVWDSIITIVVDDHRIEVSGRTRKLNFHREDRKLIDKVESTVREWMEQHLKAHRKY